MLSRRQSGYAKSFQAAIICEDHIARTYSKRRTGNNDMPAGLDPKNRRKCCTTSLFAWMEVLGQRDSGVHLRNIVTQSVLSITMGAATRKHPRNCVQRIFGFNSQGRFVQTNIPWFHSREFSKMEHWSEKMHCQGMLSLPTLDVPISFLCLLL